MSRPSADQKQPAPSLSAKTMAEILLSNDLLEALPDATVAVDRDGIIVQLNSQTQALFGDTRDELMGQKVEVLVPGSYRRQHHHHYQLEQGSRAHLRLHARRSRRKTHIPSSSQ